MGQRKSIHFKANLLSAQNIKNSENEQRQQQRLCASFFASSSAFLSAGCKLSFLPINLAGALLFGANVWRELICDNFY
jgi:hypothetical protein